MIQGLTIGDLIRGIDLDKILANDQKIWPNRLRVGDTVDAGKSKPTTLNISNRGVFLCLSFTGSYSTIDNSPAADTGVCRLSMKVRNSSGRVYIPDPVFLHNIFTPGRVKDTADITGAASGQLQFPGEEFVTVFRPSDVITHDVQNDAIQPNTWEMVYYGVWLT